MNGLLRILLVVCALLVFVFIIRRIKKAEIHATDTIFWFLFAACFVLLAAIPQIAYFFSDLIGFVSPANFIFLFVIAVLFVREFISTIEIAQLREKLHTLTQEIALAEHKSDKED
ncbi:MAG: DUF2304 domain-containing protein [Eggerthellaceae bacterium]|nr:DUF2304 domain-containing protein [Eggerthellaceae bacterium]